MTRIGLFGGSFNPPHKAHLQIIEAATRECGLDRLIVMPAGPHPHGKKYSFRAEDRLAMLNAACAGLPRVEVSDYEISRGNPSYSIETIEWLLSTAPDAQISFVLGSDSFEALPSWHRWQELVAKCSFVVARRPGFNAASWAENAKPRITYLSGEFPDVSSTKIRSVLDEVRTSGMSTELEYKLLQLMPGPVVSYLKNILGCAKPD